MDKVCRDVSDTAVSDQWLLNTDESAVKRLQEGSCCSTEIAIPSTNYPKDGLHRIEAAALEAVTIHRDLRHAVCEASALGIAAALARWRQWRDRSHVGRVATPALVSEAN